MPRKALRPCGTPGCPELVSSGHCTRHRRQRQVAEAQHRRADPVTAERQAFYGSAAAKRNHKAFLAANPLCERCLRLGIMRAAQHADHIIDIVDGGARFNWDNLQALCKPCHSRRTMRKTQGLPREAGERPGTRDDGSML